MIIELQELPASISIYKQLIALYNQLAPYSLYSEEFTFEDFKTFTKNLNERKKIRNHHIFIYVSEIDIIENNYPVMKEYKVLGAITLLIEPKIIHNGRCVGHIEDFVVDIDNHQLGIGQKLINHVIWFSKTHNCYKCILNCEPTLETYYERSGFKKKGTYMGLYF